MKVFILMFCSVICYAQTEVPGYYSTASTDRLTARDLENFDAEELSLMRNEIFARYGYIFKKPELIEHFSEEDWYKPSEPDVNVITARLTDIEKSNIKLIQVREAWLRPVSINKLPLLRLPLNLEELALTGSQTVTGIAPTSKQGEPYSFIGLLADTSKFFAVLWYRKEASIILEKAPRGYYVSTYTKKLKLIATTGVSLPVYGYIDYGPTDCAIENVVHSSVISTDLTFVSKWTYQMTCPTEKPQKVTYEVSGGIKPDGTIAVTRDNNPFH